MDYELRIVVEKVAVHSQEVIKRDTLTSYALQRPTSILESLLLDSRVLRDQELNERRKQRFASLADVVHELEETQVDREFLLGNTPVVRKNCITPLDAILATCENKWRCLPVW